MAEIIVLGNLDDENNEFYSSSRVYGGGGIAPTLGSCNFAKTKFTVEIKKLDKKDFENAKKNR